MMAAMWKRTPRGTTFLLIVVAMLLPLLALLQYRWLGQVSEGEGPRMQGLLRSAATQFKEGFDGEISRAYSIFQRQRVGDDSRLSEEYVKRFDEWEATASHPRLVREVFVVAADEHNLTRLLRLDPAERRLEPSEWPPVLAALREQVTRPTVDLIWEELPALVIPPADSFKTLPGTAPAVEPRMVCAIVLFDLDYIRNVFIPALTGRYFVSQIGLAYDVAIGSRADPRKAIFETRPGLLAGGIPPGVEMGVFDVRLETLVGEGTPEKGKGSAPDAPGGRVIRIVKQQPTGGEFAGDSPGRWRLLVGYQAGALETAITRGRVRNLALSFGVLLLLAVSVGMIIVETARTSRLAEDKMRFVSGITHELRTPLAVICSAGENLADRIVSDPGQVEEYGRVIRAEGRRLAEMVEQVLEYAGAQSGHIYKLRNEDGGEILREVINDLQKDIEKAGFEVETDIESGLPPIRVDAAALKRAVQNLVNNSIKYDSGKRWVCLRARKSNHAGAGDEIQLTVTDLGRGILKADLPHIFEPFYRGRDAVADQIQGSGLGLSVVHHTVAAHGGRVSVRSMRGQGSSFTLHLPIAQA